MNESLFPDTRDNFECIFPTLGTFPLGNAEDVEDLVDAFTTWIGVNHPSWPEEYRDKIIEAIGLFDPVLGGTLSDLLEHLDNYPYYELMYILVWAEPSQGGG